MPAQSAKELIALHKADVLNVKALGTVFIEEVDGKNIKIANQLGEDNYNLMINATGERLGVASIKDSSSSLYNSLEQVEDIKLSIVSEDAHLKDDELKEKDIIISRRVGGIAGARRFGREVAKVMIENITSKQLPQQAASSATAKAISGQIKSNELQ